MKHKLSAHDLLLVGIIAAAFLSGLLVRSLWPNRMWVNVPLHDRRIAQAIEWLAEGKRRNWKYER